MILHDLTELVIECFSRFTILSTKRKEIESRTGKKDLVDSKVFRTLGNFLTILGHSITSSVGSRRIKTKTSLINQVHVCYFELRKIFLKEECLLIIPFKIKCNV